MSIGGDGAVARCPTGAGSAIEQRSGIRRIDSRENAFDATSTRGTAPPPLTAPTALAAARAARRGCGARRRPRHQLAVPGADLAYEFAHVGKRARARGTPTASWRLVEEAAPALRYASRRRPVRRRRRARARTSRSSATACSASCAAAGTGRRRSAGAWRATPPTRVPHPAARRRGAVRRRARGGVSIGGAPGRDRDARLLGVETGYPYAPSTTGGRALRTRSRRRDRPTSRRTRCSAASARCWRWARSDSPPSARRRTARRSEATAAEALALLADALALDAATLAETRKSLSGADADGARRYGAETNGDSRRENDARASAHRRMVAMRAETVDARSCATPRVRLRARLLALPLRSERAPACDPDPRRPERAQRAAAGSAPGERGRGARGGRRRGAGTSFLRVESARKRACSADGKRVQRPSR